MTARACLLALMLAARAEVLAAADGAGWRALPGFDFVLGVLGCAGIVWLSKWLGAALLERPENYYDDPEGR